jgi:hypothetical protein
LFFGIITVILPKTLHELQREFDRTKIQLLFILQTQNALFFEFSIKKRQKGNKSTPFTPLTFCHNKTEHLPPRIVVAFNIN